MFVNSNRTASEAASVSAVALHAVDTRNAAAIPALSIAIDFMRGLPPCYSLHGFFLLDKGQHFRKSKMWSAAARKLMGDHRNDKPKPLPI